MDIIKFPKDIVMETCELILLSEAKALCVGYREDSNNDFVEYWYYFNPRTGSILGE